jgi:hypothetical protein
VFKFYCSGDANPSDSSKDPVIYPQGIHISHSKYLTVSDKWQGNAGNPGLYVLIWFYNVEGEFGIFEDVEVDVRFF